AKIGRFISEDPTGFRAGDANLNRYVGNDAINAADPSGLDKIGIEWHHMLVQKYTEKFNEVLTRSNLNINNEEFGWILKAEEHRKIKVSWENGWDAFWLNRKVEDTTIDDIREKLRELKADEKHAEVLMTGTQAQHSQSQWKNGTRAEKEAFFVTSRKATKFLLSVLVATGAAETTTTAFSSIMVLNEQKAQNTYSEAMRQLILFTQDPQSNELMNAQITLFGDPKYVNQSEVKMGKNAQGLISQMLAAHVEANNLSIFEAQTAYNNALAYFVETGAAVRRGQP
ncbi:MAG: hypothetical protein WCO86_07480, partial [Planctomycetota bacterium]